MYIASADRGSAVFVASGLTLMGAGLLALLWNALPVTAAQPPLKPAHALGFGLSGACMAAWGLPRVALARLCAGAVIALGALSLLVRAFPALSFFAAPSAPTGHWVGPLSAFHFLVAGAALASVTESLSGRKTLAVLLAAALAASALIALFDGWPLQPANEQGPSAAFLLLAGTLVVLLLSRQPPAQLKQWLPLPVWFAVLLASLVLYRVLDQRSPVSMGIMEHGRLLAAGQLPVAPERAPLADSDPPLPESALGAGMLLATLLAAAVHYFQLARHRALEAEAANRQLSLEVCERARAAERLRASEERLAGILDAARDAVISIDPRQRIVLFNRAAQKIFRYGPEATLGQPLSMLLPERLARAVAANLEAVLAAPEHPRDAGGTEIWGRRSDGSEFPAEATVSASRGAGETLLTLVLRDVTERRDWENRILASRAFYFKLFSDFPNPVWRTGPAGRREYFNQAWLEFTGRHHDQELEEGWLEGVHPEDAKQVRETLARAIPARQPFQLEYRLRRHTGHYGWLIDVGRPYYDLDGRYGGYLGSCYDITSRRVTELALRESEARYEAMTSRVPGMVFQLLISDGDRIAFTYVSRGCEPLVHIKPGMLLADAGLFLKRLPLHDRQRFEAALADARDASPPAVWEWSGRVELEHDTRWVSLRASPTQLANGQVRWDGILLDDTRSVLAQFEIERSREQLRALSQHLETIREEEKARIAREIHDELGGTLTAVKMDVHWIAGKLVAGQDALGERLGAVQLMLDSAVSATRRIATELRPTLLDDLGLVAALQWQAAEFQKRVGIACRVEVHAREVVTDGPRAIALFRIFQETLTNVTRHAQAHHVRVSVEERGDYYILRVADDGIGLCQDRLFGCTGHGIRGMGERARQFHGQVTVEGAPGKGTVITASVRKF